MRVKRDYTTAGKNAEEIIAANDVANMVSGDDANVEMDALDPTKIPVCSADWGGRGCRVLGCKEDIYSQRPVNLKYRLCQTHKSAPALIHQGKPKRFCSQCSMLRQLADFNGRGRACTTCLKITASRRERTAKKKKSSHSIKELNLNTFSNPKHNESTNAGDAPADGTLTETPHEIATATPSSATLENAQLEPFMALSGLAELLRNNGNIESGATVAAMTTAATPRSTRTDQNHQNQQLQQLQELATTIDPSLPPILSTLADADDADGAITANIGMNHNSVEPSESPQITNSDELLQQENAMAALLAVAATTTCPQDLAPDSVSDAREGSLDPYCALVSSAEHADPSIEPQWQAQLPQQQQHQPPPTSTPPAFYCLNEAHTTQPSAIVAKRLELKQQRVLAELRLARMNLELARLEEDIHKLSDKEQQQHQQEQQQQPAVAAYGDSAPNGAV